jgi:hypothetical protein
MKAKLIRTKDSYHLWLNPETKEQEHIASINPILNDNGFDLRKYKLSKQNCDEIFGVVDVEKLAREWHKQQNFNSLSDNIISVGYLNMFKDGFNKAMELNKDKLFTLEDMMNCWNKALKFQEHKETLGDFIQSLQQPTEIDVEIVMERYPGLSLCAASPELDSEGCLILKKI